MNLSQGANAQVSNATLTYLPKGATQYQTPEIIHAHGEVKTRIGILWFSGVLNFILIGCCILAFLKDATNAKEILMIFGPIISASMSGVMVYLVGERKKGNH